MPRIYIAGPHVFFPNRAEVEFQYRTECGLAGLEAVMPADGTMTVVHRRDLAGAIKKANLDLLRSCDAVIADCHPFRGAHMDPGTAYEIGFAEARGIPVFLWSAQEHLTIRARVWGERAPDGWRDANGHLIEDFDLPENLMIVSRPEDMHGSFRAAVKACAEHFKS